MKYTIYKEYFAIWEASKTSILVFPLAKKKLKWISFKKETAKVRNNQKRKTWYVYYNVTLSVVQNTWSGLKKKQKQKQKKTTTTTMHSWFLLDLATKKYSAGAWNTVSSIWEHLKWLSPFSYLAKTKVVSSPLGPIRNANLLYGFWFELHL